MTSRKNSWMGVALAAAVGLLLFAPVQGEAQEYLDDYMFHSPRVTLSLNLGYGVPKAGSDLFQEVTREFTLEKSDFNAPVIGGGLSVFLNDRVDLAFEAAFARSSTWAEYTEFIGADDLPIEHETTFLRVPVTMSVRYFLKDRGREIGNLSWIPTTWAPYVGVGGGRMYYEFEQVGEFIDFDFPEELPIVRSQTFSGGWAWVGHAFGGLQWALSPQWVLMAEARYSLAETDLDRGPGGYQLFDPIDLSGFHGTVGFGIRF